MWHALLSPRPGDSGLPAPVRRRVFAQRNPMLLFRFVGLLLFRFADRRFCGSLFQDPPRITAVASPSLPARESRERSSLP